MYVGLCVSVLCVAWFYAGRLYERVRARARLLNGSPPPPAFTLTSRAIGTNTAAPTAAGFSSTVTLGGQSVAPAKPPRLPPGSRRTVPTYFGELEGGNRGNGLLPYAGSDD